MAKIQHSDQMFDLVDESLEDNSINKLQYMRINERQNSWSQNNGIPSSQTLYYDVMPSGSWILPAESYLSCQFTVVNATGANAGLPLIGGAGANGTGNIVCAFQNNFPLFDQCVYSIDQQSQIQNTSIYLSRNTLMKNFFDYSKGTSDSAFADCEWYPDTGAGLYDTNPTSVVLTYKEPATPAVAAQTAGAQAAGGGNAALANVSPQVAFAGSAATTGQASGSTYPNPNYNKGFASRVFYNYTPTGITDQAGAALATAAGPITAYTVGPPSAALVVATVSGATTVPTGLNPGTTQYTVKIPLWRMVDVFRVHNKVWTGSQHTLQLQFNQNINQLFICSGNPVGGLAISIKNLYWMVPYVTPDPITETKLLAQMDSSFNQIVDFESVETTLLPFTTTVNGPLSCNIPYKDANRPTKVVVAFQLPNQVTNSGAAGVGGAGPYQNPSTTFSSLVGTNFTANFLAAGGAATVYAAATGAGAAGTALYTNAFNSAIVGTTANSSQLSSIYLNYCGNQIPATQYQPSLYGLLDNYQTFLQVCERDRDYEDGPAINFADYCSCLTLYTFDLRYANNSSLSSGQSSQLQLTLNIAGNGPNNGVMNIFCTVFSERQMRFSSVNKKITAAIL